MDKATKSVIIILLIIFIFIFFREVYINNKLKKTYQTTAKIISVGTISHSCYIVYLYNVNNKEYKSKKSINRSEFRKLSDEELERIDDLKIKYSVDSPWISEIIDERIK